MKNKDELLEIKFKEIKNQINRAKNKNALFLPRDNYKPLKKKIIKKYFKKIKRDTSIFNQSTHIQVLKSIRQSINSDSIQYALSYLFAYNTIDRLEMEDDIKAKNYLYFDLLTEFFNKDEALNQINSFIDEFDSFDTQMYNNKMIVRTPNDIVFELYRFDGLWYLSTIIKKITY